MSRDQQPARVRILSSGGPTPFGRRRGDLTADPIIEINDDAPQTTGVDAAPAPDSVSMRPSPRSMIGMFLFSAALGGIGSAAFGLFGIPAR